MEKEIATELEFLEWFYIESDFGPADSDIRDSMKLKFIRRSNKCLPKCYDYMSDGESSINKYYDRTINDSNSEGE